MKNNIALRNFVILFASVLLMISFVSAAELNFTSNNAVVQITSLKYEPSPANPGEYFSIWVNVKFLRNPHTDVQFELTPSYPFSLDPNESAVKTFSAASISSSILFKYKVRVDDNAVEGTNKLTLTYKFEGTYYIQEFDIDIENAQTTFDAVIQDSTSSEVSIALANTGKNTANSVIVKIPEQDNFMVTGTEGQMVGNLESGDYTIVSFEVSKKMTQTIPGAQDGQSQIPNTNQRSTDLTFDIYYTDNIGERRMVTMQLPVYDSVTNSSAFSGMPGGFGKRSSSVPWYVILGIVLVLGAAGFIVYKKFPEQTKKFISKLNPQKLFKKKEDQKTETPDWVKKGKEKEKTK